jgi:hypothetical protein
VNWILCSAPGTPSAAQFTASDVVSALPVTPVEPVPVLPVELKLLPLNGTLQNTAPTVEVEVVVPVSVVVTVPVPPPVPVTGAT